MLKFSNFIQKLTFVFLLLTPLIGAGESYDLFLTDSTGNPFRLTESGKQLQWETVDSLQNEASWISRETGQFDSLGGLSRTTSNGEGVEVWNGSNWVDSGLWQPPDGITYQKAHVEKSGNLLVELGGSGQGFGYQIQGGPFIPFTKMEWTTPIPDVKQVITNVNGRKNFLILGTDGSLWSVYPPTPNRRSFQSTELIPPGSAEEMFQLNSGQVVLKTPTGSLEHLQLVRNSASLVPVPFPKGLKPSPSSEFINSRNATSFSSFVVQHPQLIPQQSSPSLAVPVTTTPASGPKPKISLSEIEEELTKRRKNIFEFKSIRQLAESRGLRVYLFGGAASTYAHYVRKDLARERGERNYPKERFDYDIHSIFADSQDIDLVVTGDGRKETRADLDYLEDEIQRRFNYSLNDDKSKWEVRGLNITRGTKKKLLNDPDFLNQHSDSGSTALLEITSPPDGESLIRDLHDWESGRGDTFLKDILEGRITYYFSPRHSTTTRGKNGQNPEILSAIRYLTKVFQFDLEMDDGSKKHVQTIIDQFNPDRTLDSYVNTWIEINGKKLLTNAADIERAWDTLESMGLRKKLIRFKNNPNSQGSLSWLMNKSPLRTSKSPSSPSRGSRTAKDLGLHTVGHSTDSHSAWESILRSPSGKPNVFISRKGASGEHAQYGNGFYTAKGKKGWSGYGNFHITFSVDPTAVEGVDFKYNGGDPIVWLNGDKLTALPQTARVETHIAMDVIAGKSHGLNQSIRDRVKRRYAHGWLSQEERDEIKTIISDTVKQFRKKKGTNQAAAGKKLSAWMLHNSANIPVAEPLKTHELEALAANHAKNKSQVGAAVSAIASRSTKLTELKKALAQIGATSNSKSKTVFERVLITHLPLWEKLGGEGKELFAFASGKLTQTGWGNLVHAWTQGDPARISALLKEYPNLDPTIQASLAKGIQKAAVQIEASGQHPDMVFEILEFLSSKKSKLNHFVNDLLANLSSKSDLVAYLSRWKKASTPVQKAVGKAIKKNHSSLAKLNLTVDLYKELAPHLGSNAKTQLAFFKNVLTHTSDGPSVLKLGDLSKADPSKLSHYLSYLVSLPADKRMAMGIETQSLLRQWINHPDTEELVHKLTVESVANGDDLSNLVKVLGKRKIPLVNSDTSASFRVEMNDALSNRKSLPLSQAQLITFLPFSRQAPKVLAELVKSLLGGPQSRQSALDAIKIIDANISFIDKTSLQHFIEIRLFQLKQAGLSNEEIYDSLSTVFRGPRSRTKLLTELIPSTPLNQAETYALLRHAITSTTTTPSEKDAILEDLLPQHLDQLSATQVISLYGTAETDVPKGVVRDIVTKALANRADFEALRQSAAKSSQKNQDLIASVIFNQIEAVNRLYSDKTELIKELASDVHSDDTFTELVHSVLSSPTVDLPATIEQIRQSKLSDFRNLGEMPSRWKELLSTIDSQQVSLKDVLYLREHIASDPEAVKALNDRAWKLVTNKDEAKLFFTTTLGQSELNKLTEFYLSKIASLRKRGFSIRELESLENPWGTSLDKPTALVNKVFTITDPVELIDLMRGNQRVFEWIPYPTQEKIYRMLLDLTKWDISTLMPLLGSSDQAIKLAVSNIKTIEHFRKVFPFVESLKAPAETAQWLVDAEIGSKVSGIEIDEAAKLMAHLRAGRQSYDLVLSAILPKVKTYEDYKSLKLPSYFRRSARTHNIIRSFQKSHPEWFSTIARTKHFFSKTCSTAFSFLRPKISQ